MSKYASQFGSSLQTRSHQVSRANAFQRKPPKLEAHAWLVSNGDPRKQTTSVGPILTPGLKHTPSSALGLNQNEAKQEPLGAEQSAGDAKGSLGDGPRVTRSNRGND